MAWHIEIYTYDSTIEDDGSFWGKQYYEKEKNIKLSYSFCWDPEFLYYSFDLLYDDPLEFFENDVFSQYENLVKLNFGTNQSDLPTNIYIQPKKSFVRTTYYIDCDVPYDASGDFSTPFESFCKRTMINENRMILSGRIPFSILPKSALSTHQLLINYSILLVNGQQRQTYTLEGGPGLQNENCSNYLYLQLIE